MTALNLLTSEVDHNRRPCLKKTIFFSVLSAHFLLVVCPIVFSLSSSDAINPLVKGVSVSLSEFSFSAEKSAPAAGSMNNLIRTSDLPPPPEISSIPEVPAMPVEPVSPQTVKEESPVVSEPEKNGLLKPDQITIVKRNPGTRPSPKPSSTADSKGGSIKNPGNAIASPNINGNSDGVAGPKGDPNADDSYYSVIGAFLKSRWAKPSQNTLGGKLPEVLIELSIDTSGKIVSSRIVSASGVNAMDMSVKALLRNLTEVPKPPRQMTFQVLMRIED